VKLSALTHLEEGFHETRSSPYRLSIVNLTEVVHSALNMSLSIPERAKNSRKQAQYPRSTKHSLESWKNSTKVFCLVVEFIQ
jgi:hypothetical protein